jgi:hypothetical protein
MQYILGKSKHSPLDMTEQNDLRAIVGKEQPESKNKPLEDLIALGLIIVGIYALYKILESIESQTK